MKKSLRFKIFERDNFTCQYCGRKPPEVILHCDHIHPKSKGGEDDEINLLTSCRDCNLGKRDKILKNPNKIDVKKEVESLKEAEQQIKEYYKYLKKLTGYKENNPIVGLICEEWEKQSAIGELTEIGKKEVKNLLKKFSAEEIIEAIKISWGNTTIEDEDKWQYMCGVLKNFKLKKENPELAEQKKNFYKIYYRLLTYWKEQSRGSGYLPKWEIEKWLIKYTENEILEAMDTANGCWSPLKEIMNKAYN